MNSIPVCRPLITGGTPSSKKSAEAFGKAERQHTAEITPRCKVLSKPIGSVCTPYPGYNAW